MTLQSLGPKVIEWCDPVVCLMNDIWCLKQNSVGFTVVDSVNSENYSIFTPYGETETK